VIDISAAAAKAREKARDDADPRATETGVLGTRRDPVTLDAQDEATLSDFVQRRMLKHRLPELPTLMRIPGAGHSQSRIATSKDCAREAIS
jgi:hypothetical protein